MRWVILGIALLMLLTGYRLLLLWMVAWAR